MAEFRIETERLVLREWSRDDAPAFHAICSDPTVMATLGPLMSLAETEALIERMQGLQARDGHCFWALERADDARLIGWCGAIRGTTGPVDGKGEFGWRLAADCWGKGYVSEGARAGIAWFFANRPDEAAWAITHTGNTRSRAVMERLGMTYQPALDFDHPRLGEDNPLRPHVTYRLARADWQRGRQ